MDTERFKNELWEIGRVLKAGLSEFVEPVFESEGLSKHQAWILMNIKSDDCETIGELAEILTANQGNLSVACKHMEQAGLIIRERGKDDERVVRLALTPLGEEKAAHIQSEFENLFFGACSDPGQLETIIAGFRELKMLIKKLTEEKKNHA